MVFSIRREKQREIKKIYSDCKSGFILGLWLDKKYIAPAKLKAN
ncbi:hypothetical protein MuYL_2284 [Mucilaginibacter xinganensis]|uniref:Uncharacterized protein n=1 Tax=Mucilaginibacter xinganensis TaxID=1234841 RepID=A0A223NWC3_9SPHI|nr:hypothetical protein MuYL_2284 [Mucilaginibacter xinganensis]